MKEEIFFVTTNPRKVEDYNRRIKSNKFTLVHTPVDLNEKQSFEVLDVSKSKLEHAKRLFPGKRIMVEDRGFSLKALNNFPGPFIKPILSSLGVDGLLDLMRNKTDREANFIQVISYFDGIEDHFFEDKEMGFVLNEKKGANLRGWTEILYIYGHVSIQNKTLAELDDTEWQIYLNEVEKNDSVKAFSDFLN